MSIGENKESERKTLFKDMTTEICPGEIKEIDSQIQEMLKISNYININ